MLHARRKAQAVHAVSDLVRLDQVLERVVALLLAEPFHAYAPRERMKSARVGLRVLLVGAELV